MASITESLVCAIWYQETKPLMISIPGLKLCLLQLSSGAGMSVVKDWRDYMEPLPCTRHCDIFVHYFLIFSVSSVSFICYKVSLLFVTKRQKLHPHSTDEETEYWLVYNYWADEWHRQNWMIILIVRPVFLNYIILLPERVVCRNYKDLHNRNFISMKACFC